MTLVVVGEELRHSIYLCKDFNKQLGLVCRENTYKHTVSLHSVHLEWTRNGSWNKYEKKKAFLFFQVLTYRHGIKGCDYLWAGQRLQSVFQSLQVDTLFRVVRCVHQHGQAVLHAGQLGGNDCKVLQNAENKIVS